MSEMFRVVFISVFGLVLILSDPPPIGKLLTAIIVLMIWFLFETLFRGKRK